MSCGNDLCQLQLSVMLGTCGGLDKAPHGYFDTIAILNRKDRPISPDFYSSAWLEENVLASTNDLEACAAFYDTLATINRSGSELAADVPKLALPSNRMAPQRIKGPTKLCTKAFSPHDYINSRKRSYMIYAKYMEKVAYGNADLLRRRQAASSILPR